MSDLTLFQIDDSLLQLMEAREQLREEVAQPGPELEARLAELAEVERLLEEYKAQLPAKIDRVRGFILQAEALAEGHRAEAQRQARLAQMWESRAEHVKQMAADVIGRVPDRKRLNGSTGYLLLKGNGGLAPLVVTNPDEVPDSCCKYVGWIGAPLWNRLKQVSDFIGDPLAGTFWNDFKLVREVDNERARAALKAEGGIPGAHLGDRGKHVEVK